MRAIILAGGKGTRLAPYTNILPKPLLPIGEKPIMEILIHQIKRAGINKVVLTVGYLSQLIQSYFNDGSNLGVELQYSYESKPLGTAGPLALIDGLHKSFLVTNGDVLSDLDLKDFMDHHQQSGAIATIAMYNKIVKIDLGVIELDGGQTVIGYKEKPTLQFPVSMGMYAFEPKVLQYIPKNEYLDFPDLVHKLLDNSEVVRGYHFDGYWRDLGNKDDYEQAQLDFETMRDVFLPGEA